MNECCSLTWWGGLCALMIVEALPVGTLVPVGFNHAGQVLGKKARPVASHGPPVWGLGDRLMSHLRRKKHHY